MESAADWPVDYEEIAPWYDKCEALIGVCGDNPGLDDTPSSSEGVPLPPPKPRVMELLLKSACESLGIAAVPMRRAILTEPKDDRQACFWATPCGRGAMRHWRGISTSTSVIPWARQTGNLKIVTPMLFRTPW